MHNPYLVQAKVGGDRTEPCGMRDSTGMAINVSPSTNLLMSVFFHSRNA